MSTLSCILLLLLICVSMHACSSRPLSAKAAEKGHVLHSKKSLESGATEVSSQVKPTGLKALVTGKVDQEMKKKSHASVSFRVPRKKQGSEVIISYDVGLRHADIIEGMEGRELSVVGSDNITEETISSKQSAVAQDVDVVVMDYQPPHRKTPIHN